MTELTYDEARRAAHVALVKAQSEFPKIPRSKEVEVRTKIGGTYKFSYAPLEAINAAVLPPLHKHGFAVLQPIEGHCIVTMLLHSEGHRITSETTVRVPEAATAQEIGSLITYMRRYALVSMLGLATDDDDDGNHASGNTATSSPRQGGRSGTTAVPAVEAEGIPSPPAPAGTPPATTTDAAAMVEKAQQAQQNRPAPPDGGDPGQVEIPFGKNKGKKLGELSANQVRWYAEVWEPNPDYANDTDRRLKMAARLLSGLAVEDLATAAAAAGLVDDTDGIPFGPVIW